MTTYQMQIAGKDSNSSVIAQTDDTHDALRVSIRPADHVFNGSQGGQYQMVALYSNTAAKPAGGSDVFSLRWTATNFYMVITRVAVSAVATTAYTAAGTQDLALYVARNFSASASGGTQITPLAGGQVLRSTNMKRSGLDGSSGVLWVSSGDALTAGTRTLDTQPIGYTSYANPAAVGTPWSADLFNARDFGKHPLVLTANEGIVVQTPIGNSQAAGVSKYGFQIEWMELPAF